MNMNKFTGYKIVNHADSSKVEEEVSELMKAISHAYVRGDFTPIPADKGGDHGVTFSQRSFHLRI